jgi:hydrogenase small subunit
MEEMSAFPGVTRREFLKLCGVLGVAIGVGRLATPEIADALETLAKRPVVIWSQFQECTGCSVNLLQARDPNVAQVILKTISLDYQETVMASAGYEAEALFDQALADGGFYYICEGAIATGMPYAMTVGGKTSMDIVKEAYPRAKATIAIGSCACFGNIQAAEPNPTGAKGIGDFLRSSNGGFPDATVVNVSRCPGQANDLLATLLYVIDKGKLPELDPIGRPTFLYGNLIHDKCERRKHFDNGEFVQAFGDEATKKGYCWAMMGCRGPVAYAPCPTNKWNGGVSWCIENGPCIGCSEPGFWDEFTPFYDRSPAVDIPYDIKPSTIAIGVTGLTVAGIAAHAVGQTLTHRMGHGARMESVPGTAAAEAAELEEAAARADARTAGATVPAPATGHAHAEGDHPSLAPGSAKSPKGGE